MHNISIDSKNYTIPASWPELTGRQFYDVVKILHTKADKYDRLLYIFHKLSGIRLKKLLSFTPVQLVQLYDCIKYTLEKPNNVKNLFPVLDCKEVKLHGPANNFNTISIHEFTFLETANEAFHKTKSDEHLDLFIAMMYRKRDPEIKRDSPNFPGDFREVFNNHIIEDRTPLVKKADIYTKLAILYWYEACKARLVSDYYKCFEGGESSKGGWSAFMTQIAGHKFGDFYKTKQSRVKDIMQDIHTTKLNQKKKS